MACRILRTLRDEACNDPTRLKECDQLSREYKACLLNERISAVLNAVERALAARAVWEYALCRHGGGSIEDCMGVHRLLPRPEGPEFQECLNGLPHAEQVEVMGFVRELLVMQAKELEGIP